MVGSLHCRGWMPRTAALAVVFALAGFTMAPCASAQSDVSPASLYVSPSTGTFTVGSTFTVSFYLNTGGQSVNALQANVIFPPDMLQVVSPTTGTSFVQFWTSQPSYSNGDGTLSFQGAVAAPGINTSAGLIATVTFRVTALGTAVIKFADNSRVLLNDGQGTNVLGQTSGAIYSLALPPPAGPIVTSPTDPDQQKWYSNSDVSFEWQPQDAAVTGYSYILSHNPSDIPDDIAEGDQTSVSYPNLPDGIYYFHIKALRNGSWGGVTSYSVKIDATPPATFPIEVSPGTRTTLRSPIISFITTDNLSGIDHYEVKVLPLTPLPPSTGSNAPSSAIQPFFIEATSPYVPQLDLGSYDIIVRAVDRAGNETDSKTHIDVVTPLFEVVSGEGLRVNNTFTIPWLGLWATLAALVPLLSYFAWKVRRSHRLIQLKLAEGALSDPVIRKRLEELKAKRQEYAKKALLIFFALAFSLTLGIGSVRAAATSSISTISPPLVTLYGNNISDAELLYIGGKSEELGATVEVYLQNTHTGETLSEEAVVDPQGEWFYSYPKFLQAGKYLLWTQVKAGDQFSPPSPQLEVNVEPTAFQFGASRVSYELIYLAISVLLALVILGFVSFILYHFAQGRRKRALLERELQEAEESIRRGFAVLRRDIEAELEVIHRAKLQGELAIDERVREEKLIRDLDLVRRYIGKEVWDLERFRHIE